ncbi:CopD family protein [Nocardioides sp. SYSU D00038]|uniref:copper resistance CopC/CopD family protein n=1 Tax=Nocardioides sp. SYSU D00038 TaxID=2812554 RepID=UPI0027DC2D74|nr:CopD family protein [Nocardioides sp. SYSU D00038]
MRAATTRPRSGRAALLAVLAVLAVLALLVLGPAAPASAHATLIATDPAEGAVLDAAPERITFTFNESVIGVPTGVEVFDADGETVESTAEVEGAELGVTLDEEVGDGTLVVVWRLVSSDGHPIGGSLTFAIGAPSAEVKTPASAADGSTDAPWSLTAARWAGYGGLFLAAGLVAFAVLFLPRDPAADGPRPRLVRWARVGAAVGAVAWLLAVPLVAVYQLGQGAGALTDATTWSTISAYEYVVAAAVVVGLAAAVVLLGSGRPERGRGLAALAAAAVATCAPALTGHTRAATPEVLAIVADMLHLLAGATWFGGLVALALVLPALADRGPLGGEVLARFSTVAAALLAALVVTGVLLGWRIVESWSNLVETGYGRLLLVKVAAALVAVGLAAYNRSVLLPRLRDAKRRTDRREGAGLLARATAAEAGVLVAVLLVTGLLVDRSPEPDVSVAAAADPLVVNGALGGADLEVTVSSPTTGPSAVTLEMTDAAGQPFEGYETPRLGLSSDDVDLGTVPVRSVAPGTYSAQVVFPSPGTWRLQVSLRITEFERPVTTLELTVED